DELARYLSTDPEPTTDPLMWWAARRAMYPCLSRMALDYLSIPATSMDVERTFSKGRLLLSHVRSRLSAQSTRAVLCVGSWSLAGYVKSADAKKIADLSDISDDDSEASDFEMDEGWDRIDVDAVESGPSKRW
ncbi:hATC-domain-containing protein, partial [Polyporus arcularius HHB13444]